MLGSASPRKPNVVMDSRSSKRLSLLVACRSSAPLCVVRQHALAVVLYPNEPFPAELDSHRDPEGAGIERVFDELLHHRRGTFNDLPAAI